MEVVDVLHLNSPPMQGTHLRVGFACCTANAKTR
jgi:hypothetical protein